MNLEVLESLPSSKITEATIRKMHEVVKSAKTDWQFIKLATELVASLPRKNYYAELQRFFDVVRKKVRYVRDPERVELVQHPWRTFQRKAGDCDDMASLIAALASSTGARYKFVTVKASVKYPSEWSHVYVKVYVPGRDWIAADPVPSEFKLGDEAEAEFVKKDWPEPSELYK